MRLIMKSDKYKFIIIGLTLFIFSFVFIIICNGTYTTKTKLDNTYSIDELNINVSQKKDVIIITDKKIRNSNLELTIKPLSKGKAFIDINSNDSNYLEVIYVHSFGIITVGEYFGRTNGDIIVPICLLIYIGLLLITLIKKYKSNIKDSIYKYKNISY